MLIKEQPLLFPPQPKSFAALMEMSELNYVQLRLLCGELQTLPPITISRINSGIPIQLLVEEAVSHTTTLNLSYIFNEGQPEEETRPDMRVRVYHDARQAEVISHRCRLTDAVFHYKDADANMDGMLQCRWRMNRFLYKWLNYIRRQGHKFNEL